MQTIKLNKEIDFIHVLLSSEPRADYDRFLMVFKTGETELFEFNSTEDCLFYIESEK